MSKEQSILEERGSSGYMESDRGRNIDERFVPPVKGIDLEHSLNYIDLDDVTVDFIYDKYTHSKVLYRPGSRPFLEDVLANLGLTDGQHTQLEKVQKIADYVTQKIPWAGFYHKETGSKLAADRSFVEEDLIESGYGWCNEQARIFCCLTQIAGLCSRIVMACNKEKKFGHVVCEGLLDDGWMLVDQSLGLLFQFDGKPVRAYDLWHNPAIREHFSPIYKQCCNDLIEEIGLDIIQDEFAMGASANPLCGFKDLGFHNYFVT